MAKSPFLDPESGGADGLVGVGGDLSPRRLLEAYRRGVFPFFDETTPILWWSPDPRAIFELDSFHVSRSLARTLHQGRFTITINQAFGEVIRSCAVRPGQGIWITPEMIDAYTVLHRLGWAHSLEVWRNGELGGGVYGVAVGGLFAGESMFTRLRDGSKVALAHLVQRLRERGFRLFDVQYLNDHTASLGAVEIPRSAYLARLRAALVREAVFA